MKLRNHLTMQKKIDFVQEVVNNSLDGEPFYNPMKMDIFFTIAVCEFYSDYEITETDLENPAALYDKLTQNKKLYPAIAEQVQDGELQYLRDMAKETIESIHKYNNSLLGIMKAVNMNYKDMDNELQNITNNLSNPENLTLLKDVMTKLG